MPQETLVSMVFFHLEDLLKKLFGNIFLRFPAQMFGDSSEWDYSPPHYLIGIEPDEQLLRTPFCVDKRRALLEIM